MAKQKTTCLCSENLLIEHNEKLILEDPIEKLVLVSYYVCSNCQKIIQTLDQANLNKLTLKK